MPQPTAPSPVSRKRWLTIAIGALLLVPLLECHRVFFGNNFHALVPGKVYRCAQPSPAELERLIGKYGIRTVMNLRGCSAPWPWYMEESRVTHRLGVSQEDICMSAGRFPSVDELRRVVEVLDHTEYPILIHCRQGADRTGLVSAFLMLLHSNCGLEEARRQMSMRYGHVPLGRPANLDRFFDLYEEWLRDLRRPHTPEALREWIAGDNCPGETRCALQLLDFPDCFPCGQPVAVHVRSRNTGRRPWHLHSGSNAGIHLIYFLLNTDDQILFTGRAGLFEAEVPPGGSIDLVMAVPAIQQPGRYRLRVDMIDEPQCFFYQVASQLFEREFLVGSNESLTEKQRP